MPMVAQQAPYTLFVVDDNYPESPREDCDPFGKMVCWHSRYGLGDEHDYSEPRDFLIDLCWDSVPQKELLKMVADNKFDGLRFEPSVDDGETVYNLMSYNDYFDKWYIENTTDCPPTEITDAATIDKVFDVAMNCLKISQLYKLASDNNVILPLHLYDHSGITMNTGGFSCPWDSGQVGWIYANHDTIKKNYDEVTPETLEKAKNILEAEVKDYDYYLTGQCYGFKLFKGDEEIDSCWGFQGDMADVSKDIKDNLPSECQAIVDFLEYHSEVDENEYLEQALENEDEEDMEI